MGKRDEWLVRIKDVEREFGVARVAVRVLEGRYQTDPSVLGSVYRRRDLERMSTHLEPTYLVRLFAEFESGLRDAWINALGQMSHPRMQDLLEAIKARRRISERLLDQVHEVRRYRNALVHEQDEEVA